MLIHTYVLDSIMFPDFLFFKSLIILIHREGKGTVRSDFTKICFAYITITFPRFKIFNP